MGAGASTLKQHTEHGPSGPLVNLAASFQGHNFVLCDNFPISLSPDPRSLSLVERVTRTWVLVIYFKAPKQALSIYFEVFGLSSQAAISSAGSIMYLFQRGRKKTEQPSSGVPLGLQITLMYFRAQSSYYICTWSPRVRRSCLPCSRLGSHLKTATTWTSHTLRGPLSCVSFIQVCELWAFAIRHYPEGPSTQYLRTLVPNTKPLMVLGIRVLKYWLLGPSGLGCCQPDLSSRLQTGTPTFNGPSGSKSSFVGPGIPVAAVAAGLVPEGMICWGPLAGSCEAGCPLTPPECTSIKVSECAYPLQDIWVVLPVAHTRPLFQSTFMVVDS